MRNWRLAIAAVVLALSAVAAAASETTCIAAEDLVTFVRQQMPDAGVTRLRGAEASIFVASFNRLLPGANLTADEIVIIDQPQQTAAFRVVLFEKGCMTRFGAVERPLVRSLLNKVSRSGA